MEFDLIERYFSHLGTTRRDVRLGVGDDAALLAPPPGVRVYVAASSMSPEPDACARTFAAGLVEHAAAALLEQAVQPAWASLALSLEAVDHDWLRGFADGLDAALRARGVALVGGDTTRGPTTATLQVLGFGGDRAPTAMTAPERPLP